MRSHAVATWCLLVSGCVGVSEKDDGGTSHSGDPTSSGSGASDTARDSGEPAQDTGACDNTRRSPEDQVTAPTDARTAGCPPPFEPVPPDVAGCTSVERDDYQVQITVHDDQGRVISYTLSSYQAESTTTWTYDPITGALTSRAEYDDTYPYLIGESFFDHTFDAEGRILSTTTVGTGTTRWFEYGPCGLDSTETTSNGVTVESSTTTWFVDGWREDEDSDGDGTVDQTASTYVEPVSGAPREEWRGDEVSTWTVDPATGWMLEYEYNGLLRGFVHRYTLDSSGRPLRKDSSDRCGDSWFTETTWTCP